MIARWLEKLELWLRHKAEKAPMTVYCEFCDIAIKAPGDEIIDKLYSHFDHPSHKAARARKEGKK